MYDYLDQPVGMLNPGSRFVLNAMRVWVNAVRQRLCPPRALMAAIPQPELFPAVGDLHRTMLTLHHFGCSSMPFGALDFPTVTEGEAIMLTLWASISADQPERTQALLDYLVSEAATAPMQAAMVRAAACFRPLG